MKSYRLVYNPEPNEKRFLFTNVTISELTVPVMISREKPVKEEIVFNTKKKSEQVEYEDDGYRKLKEKEGCLLVVEDSDNRVYSGKMQDLGASGSCYFVFINMGTYLKVVPVRKWYRFSQRTQQDIIQEGEGEVNEGEMMRIERDISSEDEREDIDFEDDFDDDDGEEANVFVVKEKRLNSAGHKMRNIMENYEEKESESESADEEEKGSNQQTKALTKAELYEMLRGKRVALRDLLKGIKVQYGLEEGEKELLKEFIGESCGLEVDETNGEKYVFLKK
ncbi:hypothetical protein OCOL_001216 [Ordospora colligata]|uniref:Transcription initiation factor IIF subunit alpha n=1 Tax=Ordospora colligata OC4 TaxID=1354746 RepID=A0A0B2UI44_9MICR|nr:uncharacterized protein M896_121110 [Ordospora colligata OC4]KHN68889.1 hypothetical protein M896_121110 [Ordospora colligata OC4]TBU13923.1 hypothetical protein CWI40_121110 [Ordospora colligata]TBU14112.1 hypothetical protein CWI41_121110 [Ordospora colligata]